jgi:hypothetical protein
METKQDLLIRRPLLFPPSKEVLSASLSEAPKNPTATCGGSPRAETAGPATSDNGAQGTGVVLQRMHEDRLAPIFWLALGCALGWQTKVCYTAQNEIIVLP